MHVYLPRDVLVVMCVRNHRADVLESFESGPKDIFPIYTLSDFLVWRAGQRSHVGTNSSVGSSY